ncbi:MAG: Fic family protein [Candidatus Riflebacteria bacterium]|nr:Fic family protein [Candidatus Riflebacteria bacterium]
MLTVFNVENTIKNLVIVFFVEKYNTRKKMNKKSFISERAGKVKMAERGYYAFIPNPLPIEIRFSEKTINLLSEANRLLGELSGVGRMLPNPYLLVKPAMDREAILSSKIEGTQSGISDLFFFEADNTSFPASPDLKEVINYILALEYGLERIKGGFPVCLRLIREIHEKLMLGVRGEHATPGSFRTTQNWIGQAGCNLESATYVPPPENEMNDCLANLELFIHNNDSNSNIIKLALIHSHFESIHPFVDGNGRIGRLLIILLMCDWKILSQPLLYLSEFFEKNRDEYYSRLLNINQKGEIEEWIDFFLYGIKEQAMQSLQTTNTLIDLQHKYRDKIKGKSISKATTIILDHIFTNPIISTKVIIEKYNVNFRTALKAIENLSELGILFENTGQRRNRLWVAKEILNIYK